MSLTPLLVQYSQKISKEVMHHSEKVFGLNKTLPGQFTEHTIICGYGRVGQIVSRFLKMESLPFIVLDRDPMRVKEARKGGENIEFGDASRRDILLIAGLEKAKLLIITFDDLQRSKALLEVIRPINPDIKVLVRTKSDRGLAQLKAAGATAVVPEVLEGSLMMVAHVLLLSGVSHRKIMRRMDDERKMQYENLHGFYYGELEQTKARFSDNSEFDEVEKLHAVRLPTLSEFIGKPISSFKVKGVIIKKLQREGGQVIKIKPASCFKVNDLLLLLGEQQNLEKADTLLLKVREAPSK
ncbi:NAD-binding protein [Psychromonas algarum]